jgi:hypothetical protein
MACAAVNQKKSRKYRIFCSVFESKRRYLPGMPGNFCRVRQKLPGASAWRENPLRDDFADARKIDGSRILTAIRHGP